MRVGWGLAHRSSYDFEARGKHTGVDIHYLFAINSTSQFWDIYSLVVVRYN